MTWITRKEKHEKETEKEKKLHEKEKEKKLHEKESFADILQIRCSYKFPKFHQEIPVLESLKVVGLKTPAQVFSCEICEIFKNTFSTQHLW